ncbi:MAG: hypothetical protein ACO3NL_06000 [Phycisphaerales bacterium]
MFENRRSSDVASRGDGFTRRSACTAIALFISAPVFSQSPFAANVIEYVPGDGVPQGYDDGAAVLGIPSRFTDDPLFPAAVTPFSSPYLPSQVCSVGEGGRLVVEFESPVRDHPTNPYGIDLLIFGNSFFIDAAWPSGTVGGLFNDGGVVEVSLDGKSFVVVPAVEADGLFPTMGYVDTSPYPTEPGLVETDFTKPVDPAMGPMLIGLSYEQVVEVYAGSGGGAGIDLATVGLAEIRFVRISVPVGAGITAEIDGFADVSPDSQDPDPDLDGDGTVGGSDLTMLLAAWGNAGGDADLDGDGIVGGSDLTVLLAAWK